MFTSPFIKPLNNPLQGFFAGGGIPGNPRAYFKAPNLVDSIGLSVDDYDAIGATWQPVFYSDPSTPILHTLAEWILILLANGNINFENVLCTEAKGFAVYPIDTPRETLDKALLYLRYFYPLDLVALWNAKDGLQSAVGGAWQYSYAGPQYDSDGVSVGAVPARHYDEVGNLKGYWGGPAYGNLFTNATPQAETKTLTPQKYCLQVFGMGASAVCSYGTSIAGVPLIFTATDGGTLFTPTNCTKWMLSTAGGYVWSYIPPATSVVSAVGTSSNNGMYLPMSAEIIEAFAGDGVNPAKCTVAALVTMGVGSAELLGIVSQKNIFTVNNTIPNPLFYRGDMVESASVVINGYDGTTYRSHNSSWNKDEAHLKILQTNLTGTQYRVGIMRYNLDMTPIGTINWSEWTSFDGSFDPLTVLRWFYHNIVPIWARHLQIWRRGEVADAEILAYVEEA
jgi:hypothetical protein